MVLSWGSNTAGQLGLGDYLTRVMPAPVDALAQTTVLALVCGSRTTLALDKEGRVFSWGKGEDGQLGLGERGTVVKPRLVTALLQDAARPLTRGERAAGAVGGDEEEAPLVGATEEAHLQYARVVRGG